MTATFIHPHAPALGTKAGTRASWLTTSPTPTPTLAQALDDLIALRHLPAYLRHLGDPGEAAAVEAVQRAWAAYQTARAQEEDERNARLTARLDRETAMLMSGGAR